MKMIYEAKEELDKGIRPALKECPDISGYDVIFLGFPKWSKVFLVYSVYYVRFIEMNITAYTEKSVNCV